MATDRSEALDEARRAAEGRGADQLLERLADRIGGQAGVQAVFGAPIERGELTVIPVARLRWGFGGGAGSGPLAGGEGDAQGTGSGGGGGVIAVPAGYIEMGPTGSTFRPIVDPYPSPLFLLAAEVTVSLILRAVARLIRG